MTAREAEVVANGNGKVRLAIPLALVLVALAGWGWTAQRFIWKAEPQLERQAEQLKTHEEALRLLNTNGTEPVKSLKAQLEERQKREDERWEEIKRRLTSIEAKVR